MNGNIVNEKREMKIPLDLCEIVHTIFIRKLLGEGRGREVVNRLRQGIE